MHSNSKSNVKQSQAGTEHQKHSIFVFLSRFVVVVVVFYCNYKPAQAEAKKITCKRQNKYAQIKIQIHGCSYRYYICVQTNIIYEDTDKDTKVRKRYQFKLI